MWIRRFLADVIRHPGGGDGSESNAALVAPMVLD